MKLQPPHSWLCNASGIAEPNSPEQCRSMPTFLQVFHSLSALFQSRCALVNTNKTKLAGSSSKQFGTAARMLKNQDRHA